MTERAEDAPAAGARDARRELRRPVESIALPFLGSRGDDLQPFPYLLRDASSGGLGILLPSWLTGRQRLQTGETIFPHLPFGIGERSLNRGQVAWQRWSEEAEGQMVGIRLTGGTPVPYPLYLALDEQEVRIDLGRFQTSAALAERIIHDSVLLKRGILVYLRHLEALFSRVGELSREDYRIFREEVIADVRRRLQRNADYLAQYDPRLTATPQATAITERIDLEELRAAMEPEIHLELFELALGYETSSLYLESIKRLEHRLYLNYNAYVALYIASLYER